MQSNSICSTRKDGGMGSGGSFGFREGDVDKLYLLSNGKPNVLLDRVYPALYEYAKKYENVHFSKSGVIEDARVENVSILVDSIALLICHKDAFADNNVSKDAREKLLKSSSILSAVSKGCVQVESVLLACYYLFFIVSFIKFPFADSKGFALNFLGFAHCQGTFSTRVDCAVDLFSKEINSIQKSLKTKETSVVCGMEEQLGCPSEGVVAGTISSLFRFSRSK